MCISPLSNIVPRICCNRTGPSTFRWKEYVVKMVKLCEVLGLTHFCEQIGIRKPRSSIGMIILVNTCAAVVLGSVVGVALYVAKVPFYAVVLGGVWKVVKIASTYFLSLGLIAFIGAFIIHNTKPGEWAYQEYIHRSVNRWLDNNELDTVYRLLPRLDWEPHPSAYGARRKLAEILVDSGCTDLKVFDKLLFSMDDRDQDACYERIARKIYEQDHDVKLVLSILIADIRNRKKRDELLQHYAELQIEEGNILHMRTQESLSHLGLPQGIPDLVTAYASSIPLEMAYIFANGIESVHMGPGDILSCLNRFYLKKYGFIVYSDRVLSRSSVIFEQFLAEANAVPSDRLVGNCVSYRDILGSLRQCRQGERAENARRVCDEDVIHALRAAGQARQQALIA